LAVKAVPNINKLKMNLAVQKVATQEEMIIK
jgi:hypothetical protein